MPNLDFAELKSRIRIEDAILVLGLKGKWQGAQFRSACTCKPDDDRILVVNKIKQAFYCHNERKGGDAIGLLAHVRGIGMYEAAKELAQRFPAGDVQATAPQSRETREPTRAPFDPEKYFADLNPHDPALEPLGLDLNVIANFGGFCTKGVLRGTLALALRRPDGTTFAFVGLPLDGSVKFPAIFKKTKEA